MTRRAVLPVLCALLLLIAAPAPARAAATSGEVAGVVLDGDRPVPAVTVTAPGIVSATTDAAGRFRITGVPAGSAQVSFTMPGGGMVQQDTVTVEAGAAAWITERVQPHGALAGRILSNRGAPVEGAIVGLDDVRRAVKRTTDANGDYRLDYVAPGRFSHVYVRRQATGAPTQWVPRQTPLTAQATQVTFAASKVIRLDERLLPLGTITGTFTGPVPTAVTLDGPLHPDGTMSTTSTAADGSFSLLAFAGQHGLYFDWSGIVVSPRIATDTETDTGQKHQYATQTNSYQEQTWFTVQEDRVLRHHEAMIPRGVITGRLLDHRGRPLTMAGGVTLVDKYGWFQAPATLQEDGRWSITDIAAGTYRLYYDIDGRHQFDDQLYTVRPGRTTTAATTRLPEAGKLAITATVDGVPLLDFTAFVFNEKTAEGQYLTSSQETGIATGDRFSPGVYTVTISTDAGQITATVTVISGKLVTLNAPL